MFTLRDWKKKKVILMAVFGGAQSSPQLVENVFENGISRDDCIKLSNTMHHWEDGQRVTSPLGKQFLDKIVETMELRHSHDEAFDVSRKRLISCGISEFVELMNDESRSFATLELSKLGFTSKVLRAGRLINKADKSDQQRKLPLVGYGYKPGQSPNTAESVRRGTLDQRLFYMHPDSADHWDNVINEASYETFNKCKFSLDSLLKSSEFGHLVESHPPNGVVMLGGGGAFTKDVALIDQMLRTKNYSSENLLYYTIVDVSMPMMLRSLDRLKHHLAKRSADKKPVEPSICFGDFMFLEASKSELNCDHGGTLWTILGGTIGNLNERDFFNSLSKVADPNDILIVSASVIDTTASQENTVVGKYYADGVKTFLRRPIQDLLTFLHSNMSIESAMDNMVQEYKDGIQPELTDVPNSNTHTISVVVEDEKIRIASHTFYDPESFVDFIKGYGWKFVSKEFIGLGKSDFAQFLFVKE